MNPPFHPEPDRPVPTINTYTSSASSGSHRRIAIAVDLSDESAFPEDKDGDVAGDDALGGGAAAAAAALAAAAVQQVELHPVLEEDQEYHDASDEPKEFDQGNQEYVLNFTLTGLQSA
ncbi:hypothetical protein TIFTF001_030326 [Ficus carica]|uniref:Uncharacterized protein n=1 Tax=Ficus carica TaxID=3494 RepID=A0AA88J3Z7_FICCA|nr:hypothetical protein TIFTF001_030326 [Ficus carica]